MRRDAVDKDQRQQTGHTVDNQPEQHFPANALPVRALRAANEKIVGHDDGQQGDDHVDDAAYVLAVRNEEQAKHVEVDIPSSRVGLEKNGVYFFINSVDRFSS